MSSERRRTKRFTVVNLNLYSQTGDENPIGRIVNLSEGGMLAFSNSAIDINQVQNMRIMFSREDGSPVNFDFQARAVWCKQNPLDTTMYSIGIEFIQNPNLQLKFVHQLIKLYGKLSPSV